MITVRSMPRKKEKPEPMTFEDFLQLLGLITMVALISLVAGIAYDFGRVIVAAI